MCASILDTRRVADDSGDDVAVVGRGSLVGRDGVRSGSSAPGSAATEPEAERADAAKTTKPVAPSRPQSATASTPSAAVPSSSPAAAARPTLVVPGVTAPARRRAGTLGTVSPTPRAGGSRIGAPASPAAPPPAGAAASSSPFRRRTPRTRRELRRRHCRPRCSRRSPCRSSRSTTIRAPPN